MKEKYVEGKCFLCKGVITVGQMGNEEVEMMMGPNGKKVFVHSYHPGVKKQINEEFQEE
jgi:hypothetical protein